MRAPDKTYRLTVPPRSELRKDINYLCLFIIYGLGLVYRPRPAMSLTLHADVKIANGFLTNYGLSLRSDKNVETCVFVDSRRLLFTYVYLISLIVSLVMIELLM